jgi:hypothetical protein
MINLPPYLNLGKIVKEIAPIVGDLPYMKKNVMKITEK